MYAYMNLTIYYTHYQKIFHRKYWILCPSHPTHLIVKPSMRVILNLYASWIARNRILGGRCNNLIKYVNRFRKVRNRTICRILPHLHVASAVSQSPSAISPWRCQIYLLCSLLTRNQDMVRFFKCATTTQRYNKYKTYRSCSEHPAITTILGKLPTLLGKLLIFT